MIENVSPMVSVLMKVYNGERFLKEAIDSVLNQTYQDFELLIIDDGSKDNSANIVRSYTDERIRFIQNEVNLGLCETQNKIIAEAKGKYLAVMDCDDISYPQRLEKQVDFLESHEEVMMCGTFRYDIVDGEEKHFQTPIWWDNETLQFGLVFANNYFTHSSLMFRAKEFHESGLSYGPAAIAEDYQIIIEMAKRYAIAVIPERLVGYRIDAQSISHVKEREITRAGQQIKMDYVSSLDIDRDTKKLLYTYFDSGVATASVEEFINAMNVIAHTMGADISPGGNAHNAANDILTEYVLRLAQLDMNVWSQLRKSEYKEIVDLKKSFGWRTLAMCLLRYKRNKNAGK